MVVRVECSGTDFFPFLPSQKNGMGSGASVVLKQL